LVRNQWQGLVKTEMNLQVPLKVEEFLTSWVTISFSGRDILHDLVRYSLQDTSFFIFQALRPNVSRILCRTSVRATTTWKACTRYPYTHKRLVGSKKTTLHVHCTN
jgi:hypothetical protein